MLNIIVKHGREVRWDKVREAGRRAENVRRQYFNKEGIDRLAVRSQKVIDNLRPEMRGKMFVVDRKLDGLLMDNCREVCGHTDWRRDANYLRWVRKQPEFAGFVHQQKEAIDQLISINKEAVLTPAYSVEKQTEERRQADLNRLPAFYRQGVTK